MTHLLVEIHQVVVFQLFYKVGWDESPSAVEEFAVKEAVLIGVSPHQDVVAGVHLNTESHFVQFGSEHFFRP